MKNYPKKPSPPKPYKSKKGKRGPPDADLNNTKTNKTKSAINILNK